MYSAKLTEIGEGHDSGKKRLAKHIALRIYKLEDGRM